VLYGFSMGGSVTAGYVALYPGHFDGAGIFGAPLIDMPPPGSEVRYVVISGALDERANAAQRFMREMADEGRPVWFGSIQGGVGHSLSPLMEDKVLELVNSFR
jgi:predicted esterase